MCDDAQQTSAAPEPKQADPSNQSPFSMPKMEEIGKPLLPWRRKKRADKR